MSGESSGRHRAQPGAASSVVPLDAPATVTTSDKPWWKPPLTNGVWLLAFFLIFLVLWLGGCSALLLWVRS